jgi:TonB family protein
MLLRIAEHWHPQTSQQNIMILITIDGEGKLIDRSVEKSSGSQQADDLAIAAVSETRYAPLPLWYRGEQLQFRVNMDKVEQARP